LLIINIPFIFPASANRDYAYPFASGSGYRRPEFTLDFADNQKAFFFKAHQIDLDRIAGKEFLSLDKVDAVLFFVALAFIIIELEFHIFILSFYCNNARKIPYKGEGKAIHKIFIFDISSVNSLVFCPTFAKVFEQMVCLLFGHAQRQSFVAFVNFTGNRIGYMPTDLVMVFCRL
jgi:hypothetical protein